MANLRQYGDWALITGGSSGIGHAMARQVASEGMHVVLAARTQSKLDTVAKELANDFGVQTRTVAVDLTDPAAPQALIDAVADLEIGLLIPGAAIETHGYFHQSPIEREIAQVQMDVTAPMVLAHHFSKQMVERRRGAILFVSSLSGWMAQPYLANYGASKAYIVSLGEALHLELKDFGVDISVLSPGPTDTPMLDGPAVDFDEMGMKIMTPAEVADIGLSALGSKVHAIPGSRNRMMVTMSTRVMPRGVTGSMNKKMLGKALKIQTPN